MKTTLLSLALVAAIPAYAFDPSDLAPAIVGVHAHSWHAGKAPGVNMGGTGYNESNPGLYARWKNGLTAGFYKNSLWRRSYYVGWTPGDLDDYLSVTLGVVSGYDKITSADKADHFARRCLNTGCGMMPLKSVITPFIAPSLRVPLPFLPRTSARLTLLLPPGQNPAVHLSLEHRF